MADTRGYVLGAGVTGLAAGLASGLPILEGSAHAGGICRSYEKQIEGASPGTGTYGGYRFEVGGGHWIHTRHPAVTEFLRSLAPMDTHRRKAAVYLPDFDAYIPYPIQDHVDLLPDRLATKIRQEIGAAHATRDSTMRDAHESRFGPTLCGLFFHPFHERYTAGQYSEIASQDNYKTPSPADAAMARDRDERGYHATFMYPRDGYGPLIGQWTRLAAIEHGLIVEHIDTERRVVSAQGRAFRYESLISTFPLDVMQRLTRVETEHDPDPYTSVLVINIGAMSGPRCPAYHWVYFPSSVSGFHRVGIYSNVSRSFLPSSSEGAVRASFYAECSYKGGEAPSPGEIATRCDAVVAELRDMGWIEMTEVVDPTWVETAYTWRRPGSHWVDEMLDRLRKRSIVQAGRYATWKGYGIADSIRNGFIVGRTAVDPSYVNDSDAFRALAALGSC